MNEKTKKALNITGNVLSAVIFVIALLVLIQVLVSQSKGYVSFGGKIFLVVESYSMNYDETQPDSFTRGDAIVVNELSETEKDNLEKGDVITFWDRNIVSGQKYLNTHKIVDIKTDSSGTTYQTKGEANDNPDNTWRTKDDIVGIFESKNVSNFGKLLLWLRSPTGFGICIVIPSVLLLAYCVFIVIRNAKDYGKNKTALAQETLKEQIRQELLAEQANNSDKSSDNDIKESDLDDTNTSK